MFLFFWWSRVRRDVISRAVIGVDRGFFKGGGWRDWYLGVAESMGHVPKMLQYENWNLTVNRFVRILAMSKSHVLLLQNGGS